VNTRWLSDECPRLFSVTDDEDRKRLFNAEGSYRLMSYLLTLCKVRCN
jgi:hypothetical protein